MNYSSHEYKSLAKLCQMIDVWGKNEQIRKIAAGIVTAKNPDGSWKDEEYDWLSVIKEVYRWVNDNVRYTPDPIQIDVFEDPMTTLGLKIADCDGYVILIGALLEALGFPVIVAMTSQSEQERLSHVYVLVDLPFSEPKDISRWIAIDAITNQPIEWQPPRAWGIWGSNIPADNPIFSVINSKRG